MTAVNKVDRKAEMNLLDIVTYQIVTYCYFKKVAISNATAVCLAYLSIDGVSDQSEFCKKISLTNLFANEQVVRNTITKCEGKELIIKKGNVRKNICINPEMNILITGNILLEFKFLHRESA